MSEVQGYTDECEDIDFNAVDDSEFAIPPVGFYAVELEKAEAKKTTTGKPCSKLVLSIRSMADGSPAKRGKLFDTVVLTQNAAFRVKNLASALHIDPPRSGKFDHNFNFCKDALAAAATNGLYVRVDHKPDMKDETRMRAVVGRYYDADGCRAALERKNGGSAPKAEEAPARAPATRRR